MTSFLLLIMLILFFIFFIFNLKQINNGNLKKKLIKFFYLSIGNIILHCLNG